MKIKIRETGEIKHLEVIDRKTGVDWTSDLLGNAGCYVNGDIQFDDDTGIGTISLADYEWWNDYIHAYEDDEEEIACLFDALGEKYEYPRIDEIKAEFFYAVDSADYNDHHNLKQAALVDFRERYLLGCVSDCIK